MSVPELALYAVVTQRLADGYCPHVRRCSCAGKLRLQAWGTLDAFMRTGWTLSPPPGFISDGGVPDDLDELRRRAGLAELANEAQEWGTYDQPMPTTRKATSDD